MTEPFKEGCLDHSAAGMNETPAESLFMQGEDVK